MYNTHNGENRFKPEKSKKLKRDFFMKCFSRCKKNVNICKSTDVLYQPIKVFKATRRTILTQVATLDSGLNTGFAINH